MDLYRNFLELDGSETEFRIESVDRASEVTVIAPHGGNIEPNTCEIATLIAADDYNLFCFNGHKSSNNRDLHITSHRFDHHQAVDLIGRAAMVIAIHGCMVHKPVAYLGGLDSELIQEIDYQLSLHQIASERENRRFRGVHPDNICNRGKGNGGVQLEISRGLRDNGAAHLAIASAVRSAIVNIKRKRERQGSRLSHEG